MEKCSRETLCRHKPSTGPCTETEVCKFLIPAKKSPTGTPKFKRGELEILIAIPKPSKDASLEEKKEYRKQYMLEYRKLYTVKRKKARSAETREKDLFGHRKFLEEHAS